MDVITCPTNARMIVELFEDFSIRELAYLLIEEVLAHGFNRVASLFWILFTDSLEIKINSAIDVDLEFVFFS